MHLIDIVVSIVVFIMMLSIGVNIRLKDVYFSLNEPKKIYLGLFFQVIVLPFLTILIISLFPISDEYKLGIVILSLCPGGFNSNLLSYVFNLNLVLSIILTLINSIIILFSIPLFLRLLNNLNIINSSLLTLPYSDIVAPIMILMIFPLIIGIGLRFLYPNIYIKIKKIIKPILIGLFIVAFFGKIFLGTENGGTGVELKEFIKLAPILLTIQFFNIYLSYFISKRIFNDLKTALTISTEVGLQNTPLALLITGTILLNNTAAIPSIVFASFSFVSTTLFILITKKT